MIRALVWKDRWFLLVFGLVGLVFVLGGFVDAGFLRIWVVPSTQGAGVQLAFALLVAPALGLYAALREKVFRTRDYVRHRPVPSWKFVCARHLGCVAAMLLGWAVVPALLHLGWCRLTRADFAMLDPDAFRSIGANGVAALALYAAGHYAGTLSRRWAVGLVLGIAWVVVPFSLVAVVGPSRLGEPGARTILAATLLLLTALLLLASYQQERAEDDPDRPFAWRRVWLSRTFSVLGLVLLATFWPVVLAGGIVDEIRSRFPDVVITDGQFSLTVEEPRRGWYLVDEQHRNLTDEKGAPVRPTPEMRVLVERRHEEGSAYWFDRPQLKRGIDWRGMGPETFVVLDRARHRVEVIKGGAESGEPHYRIALQPEEGSFSAKAAFVDGPYDGPAFVWDDQKKLLVRLELSPSPSLVSVKLPEGEPIVRLSTWLLRRAKRALVKAPGPDLWAPERDDGVVFALQGTRGIYLYGRRGFVAATPELRADLEEQFAYTTRVTGRGPLNVRVDVVDRAGILVFSTVRAPKTFGARALASLVYGVEVLTPPFVHGPSGLPGSRAATAAFALVLALWTLGRSRRLGLPWPRAAGWSLATAAGGFAVFVAYRLWETKRAWRSLPAAAEAKPSPLIAERPSALDIAAPAT